MRTIQRLQSQIIAACLGFGVLLSVSQSTADEGPAIPPDSYPGWNVGRNFWVELAKHHVTAGVQGYYAVYGEFPRRWSDVVAAQIYQVPLTGYSGEMVDPDDQAVNDFGDVYYLPDLGLQRARIVSYRNPPGGMTTDYQDISAVPTFRERFEAGAASGSPADLMKYSDDTPRLIQFATLGAVRRGLMVYRDLHGDFPRSFDEFIASGLSPVDRRSINPVTGQTYMFKQAPGDILYEYRQPSASGNPGRYKLVHCNRDGSLPQYWFTY